LTSTPTYAHHVQLLARSFASTTQGAAGGNAAPASYAITLKYDGSSYAFSTSTHTVGEFLAEQGIEPENGDYVRPSLATPVQGGMTVEYRDPTELTLVVGNRSIAVRSSAATVREMLREQHVAPSSVAAVSPALDEPLAPSETVRVTSWLARTRIPVAAPVVQRVDFSLGSRQSMVLAAGRSGIAELTYRLTQADGDDNASRTLVNTRIVRKPAAKIVVHGVSTSAALALFAQRGFANALALAGTAIHMMATAYTASCYGCSGIAAIGVPAGHGVVAVDPRVIPLGSKLFIPGYGRAIAGDTGGSIVGSRIDLGFNSQDEAMSFGMRPVTVYVLR
jgi:uncharacterized protein YabE (DUF348 family)/3D (Asp-Asp-Asp) domain-containing protein